MDTGSSSSVVQVEPSITPLKKGRGHVVNIAVVGNVDAAKCFAQGTKVMMCNGKLIKVEKVKVGDKLMGDDSKPREVLETHSGNGQLYKIIPKNGKEYVVNGEHILSLKYSNHESVYYDKARKRYCAKYCIIEDGIPQIRYKSFPLDGESEEVKKQEADKFMFNMKGKKLEHHDIVEISVKDYLKLCNSLKSALKWYRVGVEFREKSMDMDPYILGIWLGDGHSSGSSITTADQEIVDYFAEKLRDYNCEINKTSSKYGYYIKQTKINNKKFGNEMLNFLRDNNLLNNKHIPDEFKYNSRENRMKLLAGLIDSDGHYSNTERNNYTFCMSQKYKVLINDMIYLIRSLGFSTYKNECISICTNGKDGPVECPCYRFTFGGIGQDEIPCLLSRKCAKPRMTKKSNMVTSIRIEEYKVGKFFGFGLDGNKRFLLGDFSVSHNSSTIGVIKSGKPDDGRGGARMHIMSLRHEMETGRTSSVNEVNIKIGDRRICFLDLAGHEKYIKTTLHGLTKRFPDYALLCISLADGLSKVTKEHFIICKSFGIPMMVVFTKLDQCQSIEKMREYVSEVKGFINSVDRGCQFLAMNKSKSSDVDDILSKFSAAPSTIVPYMGISNVKYTNIDFMKEQLAKITGFVKTGHIVKYCNEEGIKTLYSISRSYEVKGVGFVVHGLNIMGPISKGDKLYLGPIDKNYVEVRVKSIEDDDRNAVDTLDTDQPGCFALVAVHKKDDLMDFHKRKVIKSGMVITSKPHLVWGVVCNLYITRHSTTIKPGYRPYVHCGTVGVSARVEESTITPLRSGNMATVTFYFTRPQFAAPGTRLGMRDGKIKGFGKVLEVITTPPPIVPTGSDRIYRQDRSVPGSVR